MVIFLATLALVSGLMVVRAKNPVHSVLFSIPVFRDTSGLLLLLGLDFSAMISPVVHIGAIAASFLFVVMIPRQWVWKGAKVVLKEMIVSFFLLSPVLWDWGLTWVAPLVVLFEEWLDLVLSSMEGFPLPSTTSSPAPSISSRGVSWIDEYFGPEVSSSAPDDQGPRQQEAVVQPTAPDDQGPRQQEEVVQPTAPDDQGPRQQEEVVQPTRQASPSSSTGVGPTLEELRSRLYSFLSSFSKIKPRSSFIISTEEELGIADASPEKLAKIAQMIGRLTDGPNRPNSGQNAKALLTMEVEEWSKANEGGKG